MKKASYSTETVTDNQQVIMEQKLKKMLGHIDPLNPPAVCPIRDVLAVVTDKWSILIVLLLGAHKKLRFNELKRIIPGISAKILTARLKRMERDGYLERKVYEEVPIRVEYNLSAFGIGYLGQLLNLTEWIAQEAPMVIKKRVQFGILEPAKMETKPE